MNEKYLFDSFITNKNIGDYNSCEVIEIFGIDEKQEFYNIYCLVIFENSELELDKEECLMDKLLYIDKNNSVGLKKTRISLDRAKDFWQNLKEKNIYKIGKQELAIDKMKYYEKLFIERTESSNHSINNILKNNFDNGSYIFEFFNINKTKLKFLFEDPRKLNKLSEKISEYIPIKIGTMSDRLGNVVFQFPINSFKVQIIAKDEVELSLLGDDSVLEGINIIAKSERDGLLFDIEQTQIIKGKKIKKLNINIKDTANIKIEMLKGDLLLYKNEVTYILEIGGFINCIGSQKRIFKIDDNVKTIEIMNSSKIGTNNKNENESCFNWMNQRKFDSELKDLEAKKSFLQYKGNQKEEALENIRELINMHGGNGVYLWDPYATANDIKNTLYYNKQQNSEMRVITNLNQSQRSDCIEKLELDDKEYLMINLEIRNRTDSFGWKFHDRFLIFPLDKPKVWSLGISLNQIGESHHILQEVSQPQHILNSFNELWESLNSTECCLWKI